MNCCLISVEYFSGGQLAFFKKISFAGFTAERKSFTKEIIFKYPAHNNNNNNNNDTRLYDIEGNNTCGNLELKRLDEDVIKTLAKFTKVFVRGTATRNFINNYVTSHTEVVDIASIDKNEHD